MAKDNSWIWDPTSPPTLCNRFPIFFQALSSWPIHSVWGTWGLVLGDVDTIVSKVVP